MRQFLFPFVAVAAIATAAPIASDAPLVEDKGVKVDALDVEANLTRIPEVRRGEFRTSYGRIASVVDGVFIARSAAEKARALGLDKDPIVQRRMQQVQEEVLAEAYWRSLEKEAFAVDLEQRVREQYLVDKAKFVSPEMVYVQHILVGLGGRTRDMARKRAEEAGAKLKAGEDFLAVAATYSDDPEKTLNKGDLGFQPPAKFLPPLRSQVAKMSRKGEISPIIETEHGFHIMRFVERQPERQLGFDDVKKELVAKERERLAKQRVDAAVLQMRSSPTAKAYRENVEALVVPIDPRVIENAVKAQEALGKALEAQKAK
jgi:peptidyl-prolyl cis-trans isomerase C